MQKKIITSIILLFLLLLGLFGISSSLAYEPEYTIDWIDLKNMAYVAYTNHGTQFTEYSQTLSDLFEDYKEDLQFFINIFNTKKAIIYQYNSTNYNQRLYITYSDNDGYLYNYDNHIYGSSVHTYYIRFYDMTNGGQMSISNIINGGNNGISMLGNGRFYTNTTIYSNSNLNATLVKDGYTYSEGNNNEFLTGIFSKNIFEFNGKGGLPYVTVNNFQNCIYVQNSGWVNSFFNIGKLEKYSNLKDITINRYAYNNMTKTWYLSGTIEPGDFLFVNHYNNEDYADIELVSTKYTVGGYVYQINFIPKNIIHDTITVNLYLQSNNDVLTGSTLNTNNTFSGDFYNNYINDTNSMETNESIDNVSNTLTDDSEVDSILGGLSGDSIIDDLGWSPLDNPFTTTVLTFVDNLQDVLLGSGNQTLDLGFFGSHGYLHSEDFVLPNGDIKNFISTVCNGLVAWLIIKYGFQLYEWVRQGRVTNYLRQFYDKDIDDYFYF